MSNEFAVQSIDEMVKFMCLHSVENKRYEVNARYRMVRMMESALSE